MRTGSWSLYFLVTCSTSLSLWDSVHLLKQFKPPLFEAASGPMSLTTPWAARMAALQEEASGAGGACQSNSLARNTEGRQALHCCFLTCFHKSLKFVAFNTADLKNWAGKGKQPFDFSNTQKLLFTEAVAYALRAGSEQSLAPFDFQSLQRSLWFIFERSVHHVAHVRSCLFRVHCVSPKTNIFAPWFTLDVHNSVKAATRRDSSLWYFRVTPSISKTSQFQHSQRLKKNKDRKKQFLYINIYRSGTLEFFNECSLQHCRAMGFIRNV